MFTDLAQELVSGAMGFAISVIIGPALCPHRLAQKAIQKERETERGDDSAKLQLLLNIANMNGHFVRGSRVDNAAVDEYSDRLKDTATNHESLEQWIELLYGKRGTSVKGVPNTFKQLESEVTKLQHPIHLLAERLYGRDRISKEKLIDTPLLRVEKMKRTCRTLVYRLAEIALHNDWNNIAKPYDMAMYKDYMTQLVKCIQTSFSEEYIIKYSMANYAEKERMKVHLSHVIKHRIASKDFPEELWFYINTLRRDKIGFSDEVNNYIIYQALMEVCRLGEHFTGDRVKYLEYMNVSKALEAYLVVTSKKPSKGGLTFTMLQRSLRLEGMRSCGAGLDDMRMTYLMYVQVKMNTEIKEALDAVYIVNRFWSRRHLVILWFQLHNLLPPPWTETRASLASKGIQVYKLCPCCGSAKDESQSRQQGWRRVTCPQCALFHDLSMNPKPYYRYLYLENTYYYIYFRSRIIPASDFETDLSP